MPAVFRLLAVGISYPLSGGSRQRVSPLYSNASQITLLHASWGRKRIMVDDRQHLGSALQLFIWSCSPKKRMARHWGIAKSVKAQDFDSCIRWFESNCPSHYGSWKLGGFCGPFLVLSFYFLLSQAGLCSQSRPSCRYSSIGRAVAL